MGQKFIQGQINHLTWVMVDSTDFATPESALSAATKIKIYGTLNGNSTATFFVSSGTGSLTKDIQHVGASALGIYTLPLATADLSDASAAWYDTYIISLSATGAAYQTLIVDGERTDTSYLSNVLSYLSDIASNINSMLVAGTFVMGASNLSDIGSRVWADTIGTRVDSRLLLNQSRISDIYSMVSDFQSDFQSRVPKAVATNSQLSDLHSDLRSYLVVMSGVQSDLYSLLSDLQSDFQSRVPKRVATDSQLSDVSSDLRSLLALGVALDASTMSDIRSAITAGAPIQASDMSDIRSAITAVVATVSASDISDIASAVWANTIGVRVDSRLLLNQSRISDVYSLMTAGVSLDASTMSDIRSAITAVTATVSASDISDIASAVWATALATKLVTLNTSDMSDLRSAITAATLSASDLSDLRSAILAGPTDVQLNASSLSDIRSAITAITATVSASDISDIASAVWANTIGARVDSRLLVVKSAASDVYSMLSDLQSDFQSRVPKRVATDSQLSDIASDLRSLIGGITATVSASDMSDIASRVGVLLASDLSDILSAAQQANSRVLVIKSTASDVYSLLSDLQSDFQSRVPKAVATNSQLSDLASDLRSYLVGLSSIASDAHSAAAQANSRALAVQSTASDIYSLLSAVQSDFQSDLTAIKAKTANLPEGIQKNTALANFEFLMVATSDHVTPSTGLTITAQVSIDGAAFAATTNSATEVGSGVYKINLAAADTNGDFLTLKFTAATADATVISFKTES